MIAGVLMAIGFAGILWSVWQLLLDDIRRIVREELQRAKERGE